MLHDDGFGVSEALNETGVDGRGLVVRGRHWLVISSLDKAHLLHRTFAKNLFYQPVATYASTPLSMDEYRAKYNTQVRCVAWPAKSSISMTFIIVLMSF